MSLSISVVSESPIRVTTNAAFTSPAEIRATGGPASPRAQALAMFPHPATNSLLLGRGDNSPSDQARPQPQPQVDAACAIAYVTAYRSWHNACERKAKQGTHDMKLHTYSAVLALAAAVSLAGCSSAPKPAPEMAPAVVAPPAPVASDPTQNQASHTLVQQVQTALKQDHLYHGRIDGAWGPRTQHGVAQFQKQHQLPTNGQLDDATLHAMNLQPAAADTGAPGASSGNTDTAAPAPDDASAPSTQP
jgi:hypothetical protein